MFSMYVIVYCVFTWVLRVWFFFFFSSRRRHTRLQGDWSSDVCSSDLLHRTPSVDLPRFSYSFASRRPCSSYAASKSSTARSRPTTAAALNTFGGWPARDRKSVV